MECQEEIQVPQSATSDNLSTINEDNTSLNEITMRGETPRPTSQIPPYLPCTISNKRKYTLVLDLDETLIHYIEPTCNGGDNHEDCCE